MKKLVTLFTIMLSIQTFSQVMPSPDEAAMIKGINTPVSLYNGVVSASIPLYEATAKNGASVPVALSYSGGGGIKVNEIAGVAGLGWNLQAGGSITRVMRGEPDEQATFASSLNYTNVNSFVNNTKGYDFEKDLFYFSFPGGSGRFIFRANARGWFADESTYDPLYDQCLSDNDACYYPCRYTQGNSEAYCAALCGNCSKRTNAEMGNPFEFIQTLPSSDIKVQFYKATNDLDSYFVITDLSGNKFYFGQTSSSREQTTANFKDNIDNTMYTSANEREFISTWHLDRIEYASLPTSDAITFSYEGATLVDEQITRQALLEFIDLTYPIQQQYFKSDYVDCLWDCQNDTECNACSSQGEVDLIYTKSTITAKYINAINFTKGSIEFDYEVGRSDLSAGKRLISVSMKDHNNNVVSKTAFSSSYFDAADSFYKGGKKTICGGYACYRLRLDAITRDGTELYSFGYINDENLLHAGGANKYELPPRNSYYTDHWGYYNGDPVSQGSLYLWNTAHTASGKSLSGMDKGHNEYAKANILTRINYLTGGHKEFEYGVHSKHGGVRISAIKEYDDQETLINGTSYIYSNADENDLPYVPSYEGEKSVPENNEEYAYNKPVLVQHATSLIFDLNGPTLGYSKVEEQSLINSSKVKHYFIDADDRIPVTMEKSYFWIDIEENTSGNTGKSFDKYVFPVTPNSLLFYDRGIEDKTEVFDKNNKKVRQVDNYYTHDGLADFSVMNHNLHLHHYDIDRNLLNQVVSIEYQYEVSRYEIESKNIYLDYSITKEYDDDGTTVIATTRTDYDYHGTYQTLPISTNTYRTDVSGEAFNTKAYTFYPQDYPVGSSNTPFRRLIDDEYSFDYTVLQQMEDDNIIGMPVASRSEVNLPTYPSNEYRVTSASMTLFDEINGRVYPLKSYQYNFPKPEIYGSTAYYAVIDPGPQLVSTSSYDSDGLLESQLGTDGIKTSYVYDAQGYMTSKTIDPTPGTTGMEQTTSYTYKHLVGIETVTDPTGKTLTYEYDSRNRLHLIRDDDNNIIKRYRYNYAQEDNDLGGEIFISGTSQPGNSMQFKLANLNAYGGSGNTEVKWDINGTAYTDNNGEINVTFNTEGSYTIKMSLINVEYDEPYNISKTISVDNDLAMPAVGGPSSFNQCNADPSTTVTFTGSWQLGTVGRCYDDENDQTGPVLLEYRIAGTATWLPFDGIFEYQLDPILSDDGTHHIRAKAVDACGTTLTSVTKSFIVNSTGCEGGGGGIE